MPGELEKYSENNRWEKVPRHERFQLTKPEAQVWLALYNLLMEPECRRKYEFSSYNKNEILKLRGSLNGEIRRPAIFSAPDNATYDHASPPLQRPCRPDIILDQVPALTELRRTLEELSLMDPPPPQRSVVLEQVSSV